MKLTCVVYQLGDNNSKWQYLYFNIQGILQFQIFQIPMVGADTCGFNGNTDEELCVRFVLIFLHKKNTLTGASQVDEFLGVLALLQESQRRKCHLAGALQMGQCRQRFKERHCY